VTIKIAHKANQRVLGNMRLAKSLLSDICCVHKLPLYIVRYMTAESDYFVLGVFCPCLSDTGIRGSNRNMFSHTHVYI